MTKLNVKKHDNSAAHLHSPSLFPTLKPFLLILLHSTHRIMTTKMPLLWASPWKKTLSTISYAFPRTIKLGFCVERQTSRPGQLIFTSLQLYHWKFVPTSQNVSIKIQEKTNENGKVTRKKQRKKLIKNYRWNLLWFRRQFDGNSITYSSSPPRRDVTSHKCVSRENGVKTRRARLKVRCCDMMELKQVADEKPIAFTLRGQ